MEASCRQQQTKQAQEGATKYCSLQVAHQMRVMRNKRKRKQKRDHLRAKISNKVAHVRHFASAFNPFAFMTDRLPLLFNPRKIASRNDTSSLHHHHRSSNDSNDSNNSNNNIHSRLFSFRRRHLHHDRDVLLTSQQHDHDEEEEEEEHALMVTCLRACDAAIQQQVDHYCSFATHKHDL